MIVTLNNVIWALDIRGSNLTTKTNNTGCLLIAHEQKYSWFLGISSESISYTNMSARIWNVFIGKINCITSISLFKITSKLLLLHTDLVLHDAF